MATSLPENQADRWSHWGLWIGSIGPLGRLPASGTVTVIVVGVPAFYWLSFRPVGLQVLLVTVFTLLSVGLHAWGDRRLGEKDSPMLVWDELAGFWVAIIAVPFTWQLAVLAVLLERAFDITKIPPANLIEKKWPGGWGVVGDDVMAGLYAGICLQLATYLFPETCGLR